MTHARKGLKRWSGVAALCLGLLGSTAQAHGPYRGHWGYDPWLSSFIVGAAVGGSAVYWSRAYAPMPPQTVIMMPQPVVVMQPTTYTTISAPMPLAEAYYCREANQYYPVVQTCPSTWIWVRTGTH